MDDNETMSLSVILHIPIDQSIDNKAIFVAMSLSTGISVLRLGLEAMRVNPTFGCCLQISSTLRTVNQSVALQQIGPQISGPIVISAFIDSIRQGLNDEPRRKNHPNGRKLHPPYPLAQLLHRQKIDLDPGVF